MTLTKKPESRPAPNSWGLASGENPWEYAPAPEATDHIRIEPEYGLFIGNEFVAVEAAQDLHGHQPCHRGAAGQGGARLEGGRQPGGDRRTRGASVRLVEAAGPGAGQVPVPDRADPPGALARVRGGRVDELRQADQGVARRGRAARRGALLLLRRLGRQARIRLPEPCAALAGRRRAGHPVELPAPDAGLEDRARPGGRQHGRSQAGEHHAADRLPVRGRRAPGGPAAGRREHHHRAPARSAWSLSPTPT